MHDLDWLIGIHFRLLERYDCDWVFCFYQDTSLVAHCLWRFIEDGRIRLTSKDDGHQFGRPAPVDLVAEINSRIASVEIVKVELLAGTLDLTIHFGTKYALQVVPDSGGYESWHLCGDKREFIAVGGGQLFTMDDRRQTV